MTGNIQSIHCAIHLRTTYSNTSRSRTVWNMYLNIDLFGNWIKSSDFTSFTCNMSDPDTTLCINSCSIRHTRETSCFKVDENSAVWRLSQNRIVIISPNNSLRTVSKVHDLPIWAKTSAISTSYLHIREYILNYNWFGICLVSNYLVHTLMRVPSFSIWFFCVVATTNKSALSVTATIVKPSIICFIDFITHTNFLYSFRR